MGPHGRDRGRVRGAEKRGSDQNGQTEIPFKLGDVAQSALIPGVSPVRPCVEHIHQTGAFQGQEGQILAIKPKLALKNSADGAGFTNKTSQQTDFPRKTQTSLGLEPGREGDTKLDTSIVVTSPTGAGTGGVLKGEAPMAEGTRDPRLPPLKGQTTARATVRPVPGAIRHHREGEVRPA